ncbi:MAG: hypothetical protein CVV05_00505 [Gammaproteobacteria bacterium HGW-Gammaproteobacteria-1]|jgi:hypothetical protein|nr:MAG: hypothetical protein CVV05_00505 [Gammaproteobacteria bacterium HGW-Gammaproteobacteria-1]
MAQPKDRLKDLPPIFHWRDLVDGGSTPGAARVTVSRWVKQERVEPIGGMSGLYRNVTLELNSPLWAEVFRRYLPNAIVAGRAALQHAGWLCGDADTVDLVVPLKMRPPQLDGVEYRHRTRAWLQQIALSDHQLYGFSVLAPEYALADLLVTDAAWVSTAQLQIPEQISLSDIRDLAGALAPLYSRAQTHIVSPRRDGERM